MDPYVVDDTACGTPSTSAGAWNSVPSVPPTPNSESSAKGRREEGIETNESSRFIDYTIVSPFEDAVSHVERAVLSWGEGEAGGRGGEGASTSVFDFLDTPSKLSLSLFNLDVNDNNEWRGQGQGQGKNHTGRNMTSSGSSRSGSSLANACHLLSKWFHLPHGTPCAILSRMPPSADQWMQAALPLPFTLSLHRQALGALIAGLKASEKAGAGIHAFYLSSPLTGMNTAVEVLGYCIPKDGRDEDEERKGQSKMTSTRGGIVRYESYLGACDVEHPYYYVDGLRSLFLSTRRGRGLSSASASISNNDGTRSEQDKDKDRAADSIAGVSHSAALILMANIHEVYHRRDIDIGSPSVSFSPSPSVSIRKSKKESKSKSKSKSMFLMKSILGSRMSTVTGTDAGNEQRPGQNQGQSEGEGGGQDYRNSVDIYIHLRYPPLPLLSIQDRSNYTALLPSQQQYSCWSAEVDFGGDMGIAAEGEAEGEGGVKEESGGGEREGQEQAHVQGQGQERRGEDVRCPLAQALRSLLAIYVVCKTVRPGWTMGLLRTLGRGTGMRPAPTEREEGEEKNKVEKDAGGGVEEDICKRSQAVAAVLSRATRSSVAELCRGLTLTRDKGNHTLRDTEKGSEEQRSKFLEVLFPADAGKVYFHSDFIPAPPPSQEDGDGNLERGEIQSHSHMQTQIHAPFGSWPSLCALLVSQVQGQGEECGLVSVGEFWHACTLGLRQCYEGQVHGEGQDDAAGAERANRGAAQAQLVNCLQAHACIPWPSPHPSCPLLDNCLWADILQRAHSESPPLKVSLPCLSHCLLLQKVQLLQLLAAGRWEAPTCEDPTPVQEKLSQSLGKSKGKEKSKVTESEHPLMLLRRLPVTSDKLQQQRFLEHKLRAGEATATGIGTGTEEEYIRLRALHPILAADVSVYKHHHDSGSGASLQAFRTWYGLDPSSAGQEQGQRKRPQLDDSLSRLWDLTPHSISSSTTPLFTPDKEAEACLSFFENLSPACFAADMLALGLESIFLVLMANVAEAEGQARVDTQWEHLSISQLRQAVNKAIADIRKDTPEGGSDGDDIDWGGRLVYSQPLLLSVDMICAQIAGMERYCKRAASLSSALSSSASSLSPFLPLLPLVRCLASTGRAVATCEEQAKALYKLARDKGGEGGSSSSSGRHDWYSADARELGLPCRKILTFYESSIAEVGTGTGAGTGTGTGAETGTGTGTGTGTEVKAEAETEGEQLVAELDGVRGKMRLSMRFVDDK